MTNTKVAMTLSNSIIGVSILAMPYCMKTCGVILGSLLLILNSLLTRFTCHLLLKLAVVTRKMTFEFIANHTFGQVGKLAVELNIIGFMLGILISFFVVIGDIAPAFISGFLQIENTSSLRSFILICFGFVAALPLSMLREIDSLAHISMLSILFYITLALKTVIEAMPVLVVGDWSDSIHFWKPSGILQSLPIFALALSCQTQIFEIYESLPEPSLKQMNSTLKLAINLCTGLYLVVGIFGYVANCKKDFTGNILMHFTPGFSTEAIKMLFVIAVALSFPLVIFPCRTSIHSLIFKRNSTSVEVSGKYIPETRFKMITFFTVIVTLIIGILCPNIEIVLGFVGSTIGILTCIIFPALMFVQLISKHTFEKWGAQVVLVVGIVFLASCTCASLSSLTMTNEDVQPRNDILTRNEKTNIFPDVSFVASKISMTPLNHNVEENFLSEQTVTNRPSKLISIPGQPIENKHGKEIFADTTIIVSVEDSHKRQEPPVPQEPDEQLKEEKFKDMVIGIIGERIEMKNNEINGNSVDISKGPAAGIAKILEDNNKALQHQEEILRKLEVHQKQQKQLLEEQREILKELKAHEKSHDNAAAENVMQDADKVDHVALLRKQNKLLPEESELSTGNVLFSEIHENRSLSSAISDIRYDLGTKSSQQRKVENTVLRMLKINGNGVLDNKMDKLTESKQDNSTTLSKRNGVVGSQRLLSKRLLNEKLIDDANTGSDDFNLHERVENISLPVS